MKIAADLEIKANSGWAGEVARGQVLRVMARTGVSLVAFNARDLTERFDQARTKVYNMRLWITTGERLFSKLDNPMMTVITDQFAGIGRHDLQYGMCSGPLLARAAAAGEPQRYADLRGQAVPAHGCLENLATALAPWRIAAHQIPMPLNLFQPTLIDTATGAIRPLPVRPAKPIAVELRAEMDLVVALSACPDLEAPAGGQCVRATILGEAGDGR